VTTAFDAATRGAHWAAFADNAGTIAVGALANLAIWNIEDRDAQEPAQLPRLDDGRFQTCAATISAGQFVYQSESSVGSEPIRAERAQRAEQSNFGSRLRRAEEERAEHAFRLRARTK
jgi:cytosine/adenosine deaminase-related metal-dependent hydrolase